MKNLEKKKKINEHTINYLLHMDNMVMGIAFGTAVSIIRKNKIQNYIGNYNHIKYTDIKDDKPFEFPVLINRFAQISAKKFNYSPSSPIAYWINEKLLEAYNSGIIGDKYEACVGIQTGDNNGKGDRICKSKRWRWKNNNMCKCQCVFGNNGL